MQKKREGYNLIDFEVSYKETKNGVTLEVLDEFIKLTGKPNIADGYIAFDFPVKVGAGTYSSIFPENVDGLGLQFSTGMSELNYSMSSTEKTMKTTTIENNIDAIGSINVRYDVNTLNTIIHPQLIKRNRNKRI